MEEIENNPTTSTPNLSEFVPMPKQLEIINDIRTADYSKGVHEFFISGSIGAAKSLTLAHAVSTHALMYPGARVGIGRLALPQLKSTLCRRIREHLYNTGVDYRYSETTGNFIFPNRSEINAMSWADGNYVKLGSTEFSAFAIDELTETKHTEAYDVIMQRVGRLPHIKENWVLSCTNPDAPSSPWYKKFILSNSKNLRVYYATTHDNIYLPQTYIETLLERLDEKQVQRQIYGKWIELHSECVYYAYSDENNYINSDYKVNINYPIRLHFDFNIGGPDKPMSCVLSQYIDDRWHFYEQSIVDGARTLDIMEDIAARGLLDSNSFVIVHGDATGRSRDTRSIKSDYDIIESFLANYKTKSGNKINYRIDVPRANPPIRDRHNIVNGYLRNSKNISRVFVYKCCQILREGFRLTKLKPGANYIECDTDRWQHSTTCAGYGIMWQYNIIKYSGAGTATVIRR